MTLTYKEVLDRINSLQTKASLLEKLRKAGPRSTPNLNDMLGYLERIGYNTKDFNGLNIIHISGTKGKGSTSCFTQSILRQHRIRTGLFTSPHLIAARERIRINGVPITEELFAQYVSQVWTRLEETKHLGLREGKDEKTMLMNEKDHPDKPSYFRFLTLVALHTFIQEKVDCAILEVGVGGEYDATNIIDEPIVCGIAALGLDHVAVLGNTIDKIAWHKSGIFKQNVPAVVLKTLPEALSVIEERAKEKNVILSIVDPGESSKKLSTIKLGIAGEHQKQNAALAIKLCEIWLEKMKRIIPNPKKDDLSVEFKKGLIMARWPGRGQTLEIKDTVYRSKAIKKVTWYLDGAHTIESLLACSEWFKGVIREDETTRILMFNCTHGRNSNELLSIMSDIQSQV
ncbi:Mur ligase, partial [Backusella circina FSU 941]